MQLILCLLPKKRRPAHLWLDLYIHHPPAEDQPFVSPLKKQKERERKRRNALIRFVLILLLLLCGSVLIWAPGILPANVRGMIPILRRFLAPTSTVTPSVTPSPLPTQTSHSNLLPQRLCRLLPLRLRQFFRQILCFLLRLKL